MQHCSQPLPLRARLCSRLMELVFLEGRCQGLAGPSQADKCPQGMEMTYISTDITLNRHTCQSVVPPARRLGLERGNFLGLMARSGTRFTSQHRGEQSNGR